MAYNFYLERWHENEYKALEARLKNGDLTGVEFEKACSDLLNRYEEMVARLDGTYQLPK